MEDSLREGVFARKQIFCRAGLIAWSHRRRFQAGLELARGAAGGRLLDYGCGDGTFLAMLMATSHRPAVAVGVEIDDRLVADCRQRLGSQAGLEFIHVRELTAASHGGRYDAVFCMEVLEHVVEVERMLELFHRLLAPGGRLHISVPVETGLPLIVKQAARRVAGWRGLGDYPGTSPYSAGEMWRSLWPGSGQHIERPVHRHADGSAFYDHKGFNWRRLRRQVAERFELVATQASPVKWLTPGMASQVWLAARKGGDASAHEL
ncbi:MAG: class I SAM-dependent methyltransferase [Verrucomicrobia bacterium]|nr:class I SAM-dependent methyltransferase [Verrucomicrobiota bacterium]